MKDFRAVKTELACYAVIIFAAFLMGFAIKNLYDPVNLVTGGVSGMAIIFKSLFDIPLWLTNTLLNIPLFLAAWRLKGWNFIKRTFIATVSLSVSLYVLPEMTIAGDDIFLSVLFGGILSGVGTGILFAVHATTGGTDMLAALLHLKIRQYSVSQIMQVLDAMVVLAGASVFGLGSALYAMIAIYAVCRVSDGILDGLNFSKLAIIISERSKEIAGSIMKNMERGVTAVRSVGMYSGTERDMLFCVVPRKEIVWLRDIVREYDKQAFLIVSDVKEVFGEGFIEDISSK